MDVAFLVVVGGNLVYKHHLRSAPTLDVALPLGDSLLFCLSWLPVALLLLSSFPLQQLQA